MLRNKKTTVQLIISGVICLLTAFAVWQSVAAATVSPEINAPDGLPGGWSTVDLHIGHYGDDRSVRLGNTDRTPADAPKLLVGFDEFLEESITVLGFPRNRSKGYHVESAELILEYDWRLGSTSQPMEICVYEVRDNYSLTSRPGRDPNIGSDCYDQVTVAEDNGQIRWDVTELVRNWEERELFSYSFALRATNMTYGEKGFYSSTGEVQPILRVTYFVPYDSQPVLSPEEPVGLPGEPLLLNVNGLSDEQQAFLIYWNEIYYEFGEGPAHEPFQFELIVPEDASEGPNLISICELQGCAFEDGVTIAETTIEVCSFVREDEDGIVEPCFKTPDPYPYP